MTFSLPIPRRVQVLLCLVSVLASGAACALPGEGEHFETLAFQDFFALPVGARGPQPAPALLRTQGRRVVIEGFMVLQEVPTPGEFLLTPRPVQMTEHSDGAADDLPVTTVRVRLASAQGEWTVPHAAGRIQVAGRLGYGRSEREDGRVFWIELQLDPNAVNAVASSGPPGHAHVPLIR